MIVKKDLLDMQINPITAPVIPAYAYSIKLTAHEMETLQRVLTEESNKINEKESKSNLDNFYKRKFEILCKTYLPNCLRWI